MSPRAADLVRQARGPIPQAEFALLTGVARETIARWETGAQQPSLEALEAVARAGGWALQAELVPCHDRLVELVDGCLDVGPTKRLSLLMGQDWPACRAGLRLAAATYEQAVVVGPLAAAIRGAPQRPSRPVVDLLVPERDVADVERQLARAGAVPQTPGRWVAGAAVVSLRSHAPEVDVAALRDRAALVSMTYANAPVLRVALIEDMLDLAERTGSPTDRELLPGLRAVLASGRYVAR